MGFRGPKTMNHIYQVPGTRYDLILFFSSMKEEGKTFRIFVENIVLWYSSSVLLPTAKATALLLL